MSDCSNMAGAFTIDGDKIRIWYDANGFGYDPSMGAALKWASAARDWIDFNTVAGPADAPAFSVDGEGGSDGAAC